MGYIFIYLIYIIWFADQILLTIILINFLIAVISDSYEEVMSSVIIYEYKQKSMLNRECLIIDKAKNIDTSIACSILSANTFDESANTKWARFIETIKVHLK